jgi:hypothetical protein
MERSEIKSASHLHLENDDQYCSLAALYFEPAIYSDGRYDGFMGLAERAIICAQIKAGFLRFDASKYQRPAASRAGRPEIVDELKIKRVCHGTDQRTPLPAG